MIRNGSRYLITLTVEAKIDELFAKYDDQHADIGLQTVVRSGYQLQRQIQTGIGAVSVKIPQVHSKRSAGDVSLLPATALCAKDAHAGGDFAVAGLD